MTKTTHARSVEDQQRAFDAGLRSARPHENAAEIALLKTSNRRLRDFLIEKGQLPEFGVWVVTGAHKEIAKGFDHDPED